MELSYEFLLDFFKDSKLNTIISRGVGICKLDQYTVLMAGNMQYSFEMLHSDLWSI